MNTITTKLLIFDFWGTLVENGVRPSPAKQIRYFLRTKVPFSEFITTFEHVFMTKKFETLKEGFEEVVDAFGLKVPDFVYDKMVGMWNKFTILSKPYDDVEEALKELKKDYKIVLLSNTDNFSLPQVMDKFDFAKQFDKVYLSCDTGLLKSNVESFEKVLKDMKVKAEEALMIGDSPQSDIKGAEAAGVPALLIDRRGWCEDEEIKKITNLTELKDFIEKK
ncbi:HAD family hydrolase [Candidatus Woesearchaeota archaeon]|nr:HAD family hydrolase [Candidatus Woesearchaeota archaeon]